MQRIFNAIGSGFAMLSLFVVLTGTAYADRDRGDDDDDENTENAVVLIKSGQRTFRFDTFGDEAFWGGALRLHEAIAGEANGGVGPGVSPALALALGLKVDVDALPRSLRRKIKRGKVDLDDPATTLALLKLNAVVNALVAVLEMGGKGRLYDPRLNDASKFPIASANGFGDVRITPELDRVTPKLAALHLYQLSLPAPSAPAGSFNPAAAARRP